MRRDDLLCVLRELGAVVNRTLGADVKWYLFGSARDGLSGAADIDVLVVCQTHGMADLVRKTVNTDQFGRPIHLSILTEEEEAEVRFVTAQDCFRIL